MRARQILAIGDRSDNPLCPGYVRRRRLDRRPPVRGPKQPLRVAPGVADDLRGLATPDPARAFPVRPLPGYHIVACRRRVRRVLWWRYLLRHDDLQAKLFEGAELPPHEKKLLAVLKADESMQIDEIVDRLENEVSPSEIFAALFELELAGKVKQLPGKNFVKTF